MAGVVVRLSESVEGVGDAAHADRDGVGRVFRGDARTGSAAAQAAPPSAGRPSGRKERGEVRALLQIRRPFVDDADVSPREVQA